MKSTMRSRYEAGRRPRGDRLAEFVRLAAALALALAAAWLLAGDVARAYGATAQPADTPAAPEFTWTKSLPVDSADAGIRPIGGTALRVLASMDGVLYAANGYWRDSHIFDPALPGPQVFALDAADSAWGMDGEFSERVADGLFTGLHRHLAVGALKAVQYRGVAAKPAPDAPPR